MSRHTESQLQAIAARGNVLVVAGAGTGKTSTVVERALRLLGEGCSLQQMLLVTFTEAAAAEMRQRIRTELLKRLQAEPDNPPLTEQVALLDAAHISTLHGFCLQLVSDHACELGIDPQVTVLDESQTQPLIEETLDTVFTRHYRPGSPLAAAWQELVRKQGRGSDERIRAIVVQIHRYTQTRPDPAGWLEEQRTRFSQSAPDLWRRWLVEGFAEWRDTWVPVLRSQPPATGVPSLCASALEQWDASSGLALVGIATALAEIQSLDRSDRWPKRAKTESRKPLLKFFDEAEFLRAVSDASGGADPLQQDWDWVRHSMLTLLGLAREFTDEFSRAKRELGGVDFADLEQLALRLLRDAQTGQPSAVARAWQERFLHVFVDEYQDINAAQDAILSALSRQGPEANRFLVGDVKQSIYRFRLANPGIFRGYERAWRSGSEAGTCIPLTDNFRSREAILAFVNSLFAALMRPTIGGVAYDADARLRFGDREGRRELSFEWVAQTPPPLSLRGPSSPEGEGTLRGIGAGSPADMLGGPEAALPLQNELGCGEGDQRPGNVGAAIRQPNLALPCVELHILAKPDEDSESDSENESNAAGFDLTATEREARLVALRLRELKEQGHVIWDPEAKQFRMATWRDMAVLLRSPSAKVEAYAKEFHRAGVPLLAARGGFYGALEVMDLHNFLKLLDNPLQDVPLLAVLRSPLVGMSLGELVEVRAHNREPRFWTAMRVFNGGAPGVGSAWRKVDGFLRRFEEWRELVRLASLSACLESVLAETHYESLLLAGERGMERAGNVRKFLDLARQYDPYQRQGLFRFLRFLAVQQEAKQDLEPAPLTTEDAVRLMSIHRSKGLEFPVVVVADLGKRFNLGALRDDILLSEAYGLCPQVIPPDSDQRYPSLPYWLARQRERRELLGEELRLLYVAMTRARDMLLLTGSAGKKDAGAPWPSAPAAPLSDAEILKAQSYLDWLRLWLPQATRAGDWRSDAEGGSRLVHWQIWAEDDPRLRAPRIEGVRAAGVTADDLPEETARLIEARMEWKYPFGPATVERAKTSVSELKRRQVEVDEEALPLFQIRAPSFGFEAGDRAGGPPGGLSATERGTAHHTFQQHVALERTDNVAALREEAARMERTGALKSIEVAALDFEALAGFWSSELGRRIRGQAARVRREMQFTAGVLSGELAGLGLPIGRDLPSDEVIVVQGVVDLAVLGPREICLVDFKTDDVAGERFDEKVRDYTPQLRLYALALGRIYRQPVTERWLHFLRVGRTVAV